MDYNIILYTYLSRITSSSVPTTYTIFVGELTSSRQVRWFMFVTSDNFFLFRRLRGEGTECVFSCNTSIVTDLHIHRSQITCFPCEIGAYDGAGEKRHVLTCLKICSKLNILKPFPRKTFKVKARQNKAVKD